ncbi:ABC transporter permease [Rhodococcus sp. NPDC058532]|uniref:ABC transporter permease n=1 Tax=Rhodococcus sp. NPDC058532 TaxID=3346540 RepID=UPI003662B40B
MPDTLTPESVRTARPATPAVESKPTPRVTRRLDLGTALALAWLAVVALAAVVADWLPLSESRDPSKTLLTPSMQPPNLLSANPLGTDKQGLDLLGGLIYGARVSLIVGLGGVICGVLVGGAIGIVAGYYRGRTDTLVSVLSDTMLAFPPLILLMALVTILEPNVRNVAIALGIMVVPTYIRLVRANTMSLRSREFVTAARSLGASNRRIMVREIAPNLVLPVLSYSFMVVAVLIVAEASLSYLGLSIPRPEPTWGNMIAAGQSEFQDNPYLVLVPGAALFLTVFSLNRIGETARKLWDPTASKL